MRVGKKANERIQREKQLLCGNLSGHLFDNKAGLRCIPRARTAFLQLTLLGQMVPIGLFPHSDPAEQYKAPLSRFCTILEGKPGPKHLATTTTTNVLSELPVKA